MACVTVGNTPNVEDAVFVDLDADGATDGDLDVVVSDRTGNLPGCRWLENPGPGPAQSKPWKNHFMFHDSEKLIVLSMTLTNLDRDGDLDLLT